VPLPGFCEITVILDPAAGEEELSPVQQAEVTALIHRFLCDVVGDGSSQVDDMLAAMFVDHSRPLVGSGSNRHDALELLTTLRRVVPNLQILVHEVVVAGDTAVVRWSASGTLRLWLLPPLDLTAEDMTHVFHVEDGAITGLWSLDTRHDDEDDDDGRDYEDDDDDGGPAPPGPRPVPPRPKPRPKPQGSPHDR
jgi:hypothetical protein